MSHTPQAVGKMSPTTQAGVSSHQGDSERAGIWLSDPTFPVILEPSRFLFSLISEQLMLAPAMSRSCRTAQGGQDQSIPSRSARKGRSLTLPSLLAAFCSPFAANQL